METDMMLCRLVYTSALVLFLVIRYFSTPFFIVVLSAVLYLLFSHPLFIRL